MNIDTLARSHAERTHRTVRSFAAVPMETLHRRRRRRKVARRTTWTVGTATAVFVVANLAFVPEVATAPPADEPDPPTTSTPSRVSDSSADVAPMPELPAQAGVGIELRFEPSDLGVERPIEPADARAREEIGSDPTTGSLRDPVVTVIGHVPGSSSVLYVVEGLIDDANIGDVGERGRCVLDWDPVTGGRAGACAEVAAERGVRRVALGLIGRGWVAWENLPPDAAVAVLQVDGQDVAWQQPRGGVAVFPHQTTIDGPQPDVRLLTADGTDIAR